ncbi:MAG: 16S rRNA (guanine(966)-N(2))-methyltransferase RsmD [Bacilli bacterium]|nr:16S rRNA (guanine(966)-N(2))-methyltransferase RsmD [Bacilli bacterium]
MIQIIGGKYRSRKIETPPSETTLPTKNMVRGAMMSALGDIVGATVLDLYAGSGALGIEALSRGASHCLFVEKDMKANRIIRDNLSLLKADNAEVWLLDDKSALGRMKKEKRKFDIVFLDPPYALKEAYLYDVEYLLREGLADSSTRFILEYEGDIPFDRSAYGFCRDYKYGKTRLLYIRKE